MRFDETNGLQREQLPSDPDKLSTEEAIKLKPTEDIVPTEEIGEETIPITDENQEDAPVYSSVRLLLDFHGFVK